MDNLLQVIPLLLGFFAVLFIAYLATKFLGPKMSHMGASKHIRIIDRVFLGNDKSICIIQVGKRFFLIGVTNHHIGDISEIAEADLVPLTVQRDNTFNSLFESYIKKFRQSHEDNWDDRDRIQQIKEGLEKQKRRMKDI